MPKRNRRKEKEVEETKKSKKRGTSSKKSTKKTGSLKDRAKDKMKESKKKGFSAMREAKSENTGGYSQFRNFFVNKGESKPILFLIDDPVVVRTHGVQQLTQNGKTFYPEYVCTEDDDCVLCQEAKNGNKSVQNSKATGVFAVLDIEGYTKDNEEIPYIVRPMTVNTTLASVIEHREVKEGIYLTAFDMTKLERGHSLDIIRDEDDEIVRFEDVEEVIEYIEEENEMSAEMLTKALDEYGDIKTWLKEVVIPDFMNPENAKISQTSSSSDDEEESSYKFGNKRGRKSKGDKASSSKKGRRNRLR